MTAVNPSYQRLNLFIDSSKRTNPGDSNCNFSAKLTTSYQVKLARLKQVCIPLSFYNITNLNNTLTYDSGGFKKVLYIDYGRYTIGDLYGALAGAGSLLTPSVDFTYLRSRGKTLVQFSAAVTMPVILEPLWSLLGVISTDTPDVVTFSFISSSPCSLLNADYLKLTIQYLDGVTIGIDNKLSNMTFLIENSDSILTGSNSFGRKLIIQNVNDDTGGKNIIFSNPVTLSNFQVTLTDNNDVVLDLNGLDWWSIIELIYVDPTEPVYNTALNQYIPPPATTAPAYQLEKANLLKPSSIFFWL